MEFHFNCFVCWGGTGIRAIDYSHGFPKVITSRYSSNGQFAQRHQQLLRLVALDHFMDEDAYHAADATTKRRLNYEADVRNQEMGIDIRAHAGMPSKRLGRIRQSPC